MDLSNTAVTAGTTLYALSKTPWGQAAIKTGAKVINNLRG